MSEIEFLQLKGIRKASQLNKRYNLSIGEMIEFLQEYTIIKLKEKHTPVVTLKDRWKLQQVNQ
jgi:hypothetical protein